MLSRKGASSSFFLGELGKILLIFISFIVIIAIIAVFFDKGDTLSEITCMISVRFDDQFHGLFPSACRTIDKVSEKDGANDVKWEIAEHMRKCWNQWGKGELNPAGKNIFYEDEFQCFKCYRLQFPEFEGTINYEDMDTFLGNPENSVSGSKDNFLTYFKNSVMFSFDDTTYFENMIRKDEKYAVVYVEHVEKNFVARTFGGAGAGATIGTGACIAMPGIGWAALPLCAGGGAILGAVAGGIEYGIEEFDDWVSGEDRDSIMFALYDEVDICGEELD